MQDTTYVLTWNRIACDAIYYARTPFTIATRALAMVHTAMYDAWSVYTEGPEASTTPELRQKKPGEDCTYQNREEAYSFAAYRVLEHLFRNELPDTKKDMFADCMRDLGYNPGNTSENPDTPAGIGNLAARLVIECRTDDGANEENDYADTSGYESANEPPPKRPLNKVDHWQPRLGPGRTPQTFLTPHWGSVAPFALPSGSACRPKPPPPLDAPRFDKQREKIREISACLNDEQKMKAEFWSGMHDEKFDEDVSSGDSDYHTILPVQLCRFVQHLVMENEFQNRNAIRLFFAVTNAFLDTTIAVWDAKRHYDYARPESVIHELDDNLDFEAWGGPGQDTVPMQGEGWCPYVLSSPPHAEYVSTHGALPTAMAVIVDCCCGNTFIDKAITFPKGSSRVEPDHSPREEVQLCWTTLDEAAEEAGDSRLYAGTNFQKSIREGRNLGRDVALTVWRKARYYFDGC